MKQYSRVSVPRDRGRPRADALVFHDRCWGGSLRTAVFCAGSLLALLLLLDWRAGARGFCWLGLGVLCFAVFLPPRLSVGEGWLRVRGLLRTRLVRTDRLVAVFWRRGIVAPVVLWDCDGRRVELDPRVLTASPLLWHELEAGAHRSQARGLLRIGEDALSELADRIDRAALKAVHKGAGLE